MSLKRIAVTGGAGQIAYSILFRIAHGDIYGSSQPVALHILEIPEALQALEGVKMELEDAAFPLLKEIVIGSDPFEVFRGVECAYLIGAKPRGPGMERADLLTENGIIFVEQGKALNASASPDVKVLVVGNPCNTNCLIAMSHAPKIPRRNFHAMTRLDQNRAASQLAQKARVEVSAISQMTIWGNHSSTQVPDFVNAKIQGRKAEEVIQDPSWFLEKFIPTVQKRGAAIIQARGKSSAASAASAAIDAMCSLEYPTKPGEWFSSGVATEGNPYGIEDNLVFSFPCRSTGGGKWDFVADVPWNDYLKEKIAATTRELIEEREMVSHLIRNT